MRTVLIVIGCFFILAAGCGLATVGHTDPDYETIRTLDRFYDVAVGFAGDTPEAVHAFRRLVESADGKDSFVRLIDEASLPGQLYALCGLYFTDYQAFESALPRFEASDTRVETMFGCIVDREPVSSFVRSQDDDVLKLLPEQKVQEWLAAHPSEDIWSLTLDIAGGGYCRLIRGTLLPGYDGPANEEWSEE